MSSTDHSPARLTLVLCPGTYAVARLDPQLDIPAWVRLNAAFSSVTRTPTELSVICPEEAVPAGVRAESGWRHLRIEGPFDPSEPGVLASVVRPLAAAGISVFAIATYDTDHLLIRDVERGLAALIRDGHRVLHEA